jgi:hypothetical protein
MFHRVYCKAPGFRVDNCNRSTANVVGWEKTRLSIGLRSNILTSPRSALIESVIELYRRRKDSPDWVWHFNTHCPDWPEVNYIQSRFLKSEERDQILSSSRKASTRIRVPLAVLESRKPMRTIFPVGCALAGELSANTVTQTPKYEITLLIRSH